MQYYRAQDTFVADLEDGTTRRYVKGEVKPETDELVKRDLAGAGVLFTPLDDEPPAKSGPEKTAAEPVKDDGGQGTAEPVKDEPEKPAAPRRPSRKGATGA